MPLTEQAKEASVVEALLNLNYLYRTSASSSYPQQRQIGVGVWTQNSATSAESSDSSSTEEGSRAATSRPPNFLNAPLPAPVRYEGRSKQVGRPKGSKSAIPTGCSVLWANPITLKRSTDSDMPCNATLKGRAAKRRAIGEPCFKWKPLDSPANPKGQAEPSLATEIQLGPLCMTPMSVVPKDAAAIKSGIPSMVTTTWRTLVSPSGEVVDMRRVARPALPEMWGMLPEGDAVPPAPASPVAPAVAEHKCGASAPASAKSFMPSSWLPAAVSSSPAEWVAGCSTDLSRMVSETPSTALAMVMADAVGLGAGRMSTKSTTWKSLV
eukprot:CAMPEP_0174723994 /NCGR_PEP_ID=MMETSP1094-20130205/42418_1 /TAXON_ID=156173 /ORGANISM="Chrysochromulina brevifilum, Strain UTEX LB 985" /LENGTH=323 /DNA_ID=CAMNT_0015925137 /DNA_START=61 /DNA_END=1032 /DNA_ORIENTATION=+